MLLNLKINKPACANTHCHNYSSWFSTGLLSLWCMSLSTENRAHHYKQLPDLVLIKGSDKNVAD